MRTQRLAGGPGGVGLDGHDDPGGAPRIVVHAATRVPLKAASASRAQVPNSDRARIGAGR